MDAWQEKDPAEMSFLEHVDVLRKHILRSLAVALILAVVVFINKETVFDHILFNPLKKDFFTYRFLCEMGSRIGQQEIMCLDIREKPLQTLGASEQFMNHMWISFLGGIILAFPFILRELWLFVSPAISREKEKSFFKFFGVSLFLFLVGVLFGYYILFPMSYQFLINYTISGEGWVEARNTLENYISLISTMVFVSGLVFELPVVVYFLNRLGILGKAFLKKYRKHAVVVILIFAAVITPSPDVLSQMLVAVPMYALYEISILICKKELNP
ncbi:MAG: twin-arginine translocase subunit TatC [Bacteroidia bacterium]|nr:twin-arginine translocase subunit TatC [Bacteroidia bacterium]